MIKRLIIASYLALTACSSTPATLDSYLQKRSISYPSAQNFQTCRAYGCQKVDTIELSSDEWKRIDKPFKKKSKTAEDERAKIAQSIAAFETIVGEKNGTSEDMWGTFQKTGHKQQDCVDESTNTSIYLTVLKQRSHITFHKIHPPMSRVPILSPVRWPHQTAIIEETASGKFYAVDSWFHSNGIAPEIIDLETWKNGWKPKSH